MGWRQSGKHFCGQKKVVLFKILFGKHDAMSCGVETNEGRDHDTKKVPAVLSSKACICDCMLVCCSQWSCQLVQLQRHLQCWKMLTCFKVRSHPGDAFFREDLAYFAYFTYFNKKILNHLLRLWQQHSFVVEEVQQWISSIPRFLQVVVPTLLRCFGIIKLYPSLNICYVFYVILRIKYAFIRFAGLAQRRAAERMRFRPVMCWLSQSLLVKCNQNKFSVRCWLSLLGCWRWVWWVRCLNHTLMQVT